MHQQHPSPPESGHTDPRPAAAHSAGSGESSSASATDHRSDRQPLPVHPSPERPPRPTDHPLDRRSAPCRRAIHEWRRLSDGGRPTLIACSGGADSSALALALAAARAPITLMVVRHHERPREQTDADIHRVRQLARLINAPFETADLPHAIPTTEAAMRAARYRALEAVARRNAIPFIATAHHADDQLESILLALIRGAGIDGLRGIAPRRQLTDRTVRLIRPMLTITRQDAEQICRQANWQWIEDPTNAALTRARAAIRHLIIPQLNAIRPGVALRASRTVGVLRDAAPIIHERIRSIIALAARSDTAIEWHRAALAEHPPALIIGALRHAATHLLGHTGRDAIGGRSMLPIARAIRDHATHPRRFELRAPLTVEVTAHRITITIARARPLQQPPDHALTSPRAP